MRNAMPINNACSACDEPCMQDLSPREQSMFALMLLGHGNKDIAASTGVMADTVKKHRAQVLTKMQVDSLADLLAFCKDFAPPATRA